MAPLDLFSTAAQEKFKNIVEENTLEYFNSCQKSGKLNSQWIIF
jgi:hypothetical protein